MISFFTCLFSKIECKRNFFKWRGGYKNSETVFFFFSLLLSENKSGCRYLRLRQNPFRHSLVGGDVRVLVSHLPAKL